MTPQILLIISLTIVIALLIYVDDGYTFDRGRFIIIPHLRLKDFVKSIFTNDFIIDLVDYRTSKRLPVTSDPSKFKLSVNHNEIPNMKVVDINIFTNDKSHKVYLEIIVAASKSELRRTYDIFDHNYASEIIELDDRRN